MRGRKPEPRALKKLKGVEGRFINDNEPQPAPGAPPPPKYLPKDARQIWRYITPLLEEMGIITQIDQASLAMLCIHYALAYNAARKLEEQGAVLEDRDGSPRKNPWLQVLRDNSQQYLRYAGEFGLTPALRQRLSVPEPEEASLSDFLNQLVKE